MHAFGIAGLYFFIVTWVAALHDPADLPRFGKPLNNLTISVGREAVFTCIVENLGPYKVAWLRVDTQTILTISNHVITKNHRILLTHGGHRIWSLHIKDTKVSDRGWYMCQVNTDPMSSNTGYLEVVVPPDILDYPTSTDMMVREGSNVTLRCAATGTPEPTITWRREAGSIIAVSGRQEVSSIESPELEITRVSRQNMGAYLCIASNGVPPTVSKRIVLIVHFPPMLRIENQLVGAYVGQTLTLECRSEAYPRPITYWTTPVNETINNDGHYTVETFSLGYETTMRLTVVSLRNQDYGPFRCIATNSLGETDGKIKIYEIKKPESNHKTSTKKPKSSKNTAADMVDGSSKSDNTDDDSDSDASSKLNLFDLTCYVSFSIVILRLSS